MKTSRIPCVAIATLLTFGSFARAESLAHLDDLAVTAERQARQVVFQTSSLHAYGSTAQELKRGAYEMMRLASHVHETVHIDDHHVHGRHRRPTTRIDLQAHINRDVKELDRLMHEMQEIVVGLKARMPERRPSYGRRGAGEVSVSFGRGFSISIGNRYGAERHQHDTGFRAASTLDGIEVSLAKLSETVHHMLDDTSVVCCRKR